MILRAGPTSLGERANALASAGQFAAAYELLSSDAATHDPVALFTLAVWRLSGDVIRRDLAQSRDYFGKAAGHGHPGAARIYVNFLANGTGGEADWPRSIKILEQLARTDPWARQQLNVIAGMDLPPTGEPRELPPLEQLSDRPNVATISGLLTRDECDFLVSQAKPALSPSLVIDPLTGRQVPNPVRTSDGMAFPFVDEGPAIHALNRRIAAATKTDVRQGEPLQVLRYRPGQEYRAHFDGEANAANQRVLTVLIYLNGGYAGGETIFIRTGLRFKGEVGDALIFLNALPGGEPDAMTEHAGLPVSRGEKLIASRWIRQRPFLLHPPVPILAA